jgi:phosphopantetheine adenylyltransferase
MGVSFTKGKLESVVVISEIADGGRRLQPTAAGAGLRTLNLVAVVIVTASIAWRWLFK